MTHKEKASALFDEKFNCSQAVLGAFAEEFGLSEEMALNVALCFSAGMRKGEVCGAVSGAIMVLGLRYANAGKNEAESRQLGYQKANEFLEKFGEENTSYVCREILGCDISTEEGRKYANEHDSFRTVCPKMVESAVRILEDMLAGEIPVC